MCAASVPIIQLDSSSREKQHVCTPVLCGRGLYPLSLSSVQRSRGEPTPPPLPYTQKERGKRKKEAQWLRQVAQHHLWRARCLDCVIESARCASLLRKSSLNFHPSLAYRATTCARLVVVARLYVQPSRPVVDRLWSSWATSGGRCTSKERCASCRGRWQAFISIEGGYWKYSIVFCVHGLSALEGTFCLCLNVHLFCLLVLGLPLFSVFYGLSALGGLFLVCVLMFVCSVCWLLTFFDAVCFWQT